MFVGPLLGKERMLAYVDADVFALSPRVFEETSLAALEAAACGVPTVLTRECEIPGLVEAGGGLVVGRSESALAAGMESLLEHPNSRSEFGHAARQAVRARFTTERIAIAHEDLFNEVARR
jgi:glycosyltransferase involved in cell wall biosynthesis